MSDTSEQILFDGVVRAYDIAESERKRALQAEFLAHRYRVALEEIAHESSGGMLGRYALPASAHCPCCDAKSRGARAILGIARKALGEDGDE